MLLFSGGVDSYGMETICGRLSLERLLELNNSLTDASPKQQRSIVEVRKSGKPVEPEASGQCT